MSAGGAAASCIPIFQKPTHAPCMCKTAAPANYLASLQDDNRIIIRIPSLGLVIVFFFCAFERLVGLGEGPGSPSTRVKNHPELEEPKTFLIFSLRGIAI